jgi:hypothetical protein
LFDIASPSSIRLKTNHALLHRHVPAYTIDAVKMFSGKKGLCGQVIFVQNSSGSSRAIDDILMPGGKPIGVKGFGPRASARLREVTGGQGEAERLFQKLTQGGKDVTPMG